jgi:hypothetical protein
MVITGCWNLDIALFYCILLYHLAGVFVKSRIQ